MMIRLIYRNAAVLGASGLGRLDVRAALRLFELCRPRAMNSAVTISNAVAKD